MLELAFFMVPKKASLLDTSTQTIIKHHSMSILEQHTTTKEYSMTSNQQRAQSSVSVVPYTVTTIPETGHHIGMTSCMLQVTYI